MCDLGDEVCSLHLTRAWREYERWTKEMRTGRVERWLVDVVKSIK